MHAVQNHPTPGLPSTARSAARPTHLNVESIYVPTQR